MAMALVDTFLNIEAGYRSVVSKNEIEQLIKLLDIFRTASPFSRVQITNEEFGLHLEYIPQRAITRPTLDHVLK